MADPLFSVCGPALEPTPEQRGSAAFDTSQAARAIRLFWTVIGWGGDRGVGFSARLLSKAGPLFQYAGYWLKFPLNPRFYLFVYCKHDDVVDNMQISRTQAITTAQSERRAAQTSA